LNGKIRKYTKNKLSFPIDDAVKKMKAKLCRTALNLSRLSPLGFV